MELVEPAGLRHDRAPLAPVGRAEDGPQPRDVVPEQRLAAPERLVGPEVLDQRVAAQPGPVRLEQVEQLARRPGGPMTGRGRAAAPPSTVTAGRPSSRAWTRGSALAAGRSSAAARPAADRRPGAVALSSASTAWRAAARRRASRAGAARRAGRARAGRRAPAWSAAGSRPRAGPRPSRARAVRRRLSAATSWARIRSRSVTGPRLLVDRRVRDLAPAARTSCAASSAQAERRPGAAAQLGAVEPVRLGQRLAGQRLGPDRVAEQQPALREVVEAEHDQLVVVLLPGDLQRGLEAARRPRRASPASRSSAPRFESA